LSGIVGIFRRDGVPVDRALLEALARFLDYRGPNGRKVWSEGPVGFGIALLRTTRESSVDYQFSACGLEGQYSIVADARIDCRNDLEAKLNQAGQDLHGPVTDAELILHAYAAWGEDCVQQLRGDYAFAIWDTRRESLFCARDHFGIKPFYYADLGKTFLFSNTLNCVRLHPGVSSELNESAIADFFLFGLNCDNATTTFRDIRRLPPAHSLHISPIGLRITRYWLPPVDGRVRYSGKSDYVEHFRDLLQCSVADRLRADRVGILLSGGLDSSSIAATARELSSSPNGASDLRAYTITYDSLFADRTGAQAQEVAEFLRIPIRCLPVDGLRPFERWDDPKWAFPEPVDDPLLAGLYDQFQMISKECRVVLEGEGIDNLMDFEMGPCVKHLARNGEWGPLLNQTLRYLLVRPFPWRGVSRRIKALFQKGRGTPVIPEWFAPDFAKRVDLESRWRKWNHVKVTPAHPLLPKAHASLSLPHWAHMFELQSPGVTRYPVEVRCPFLDLRVVEFVLALPPFPCLFDKKLLREAMSGRLPERTRLRQKRPLARDPLLEILRKGDKKWLDGIHWSKEMEQFVDLKAVSSLHGQRNSGKASADIRPMCLNLWLQCGRQVGYNLRAEVCNG